MTPSLFYASSSSPVYFVSASCQLCLGFVQSQGLSRALRAGWVALGKLASASSRSCSELQEAAESFVWSKRASQCFWSESVAVLRRAAWGCGELRMDVESSAGLLEASLWLRETTQAKVLHEYGKLHRTMGNLVGLGELWGASDGLVGLWKALGMAAERPYRLRQPVPGWWPDSGCWWRLVHLRGTARWRPAGREVWSGQVGSGRVRSGKVGLGWVASGRVGLDWVGSDRVRPGRIGLIRFGFRLGELSLFSLESDAALVAISDVEADWFLLHSSSLHFTSLYWFFTPSVIGLLYPAGWLTKLHILPFGA